MKQETKGILCIYWTLLNILFVPLLAILIGLIIVSSGCTPQQDNFKPFCSMWCNKSNQNFTVEQKYLPLYEEQCVCVDRPVEVIKEVNLSPSCPTCNTEIIYQNITVQDTACTKTLSREIARNQWMQDQLNLCYSENQTKSTENVTTLYNECLKDLERANDKMSNCTRWNGEE